MRLFTESGTTPKANRKFIVPINIWTVTGLSLVVIGLSFAIYLPSLGYYLDDWPKLYSLIVRGSEGIKTYYLYDGRPLGWWPDLLIYNLFGTNPIIWHLTSLFLRWTVCIFFWCTFIRVWPGQKREIFWVSILLGVFPSFLQQSISLTFMSSWMSYSFYAISLFLMILSIDLKKWKFPLLFLSLLLDIISLITVEYFIGLEILRPIVIYFYLRNSNSEYKFLRIIKYWLPFLLTIILFSIWRLFTFQDIRGISSSILTQFNFVNFKFFTELINRVFKDTVFLLFDVWFKTISFNNIDLNKPYLVFANIITLIVIGILLLLTKFLVKDNKDQNTDNIEKNFSIQLIIIGFLGILFGTLPGCIIGRSISSTGLWNDRFSLPAIFTLPLLIVGINSLLINHSRRKREIILIILLSLAIGYNFSITNEYKWSTTWQNRFFEQLQWRVPELKADTSLLADNELFTKMGVYPTSFMLNLFYPVEQPMPILDHWFFTINKYFPNNVADLGSGMEIKESHWYATYSADSRNSLVINWTRDSVNCLWVLSSKDRYNPMISENTRIALPASNLSRIIVDGPEFQRDVNLFGKEDRNTWCYYYEKADLARQSGKWNEVVSLYESAEAANYHPANGIELMPFIEAFARTGKADVAQNLTVQAKSLTPLMRDYTCDTWNRVAKDVQNDPVFDAEYKAYSEQDLCWEVK